jgi:hypothetical protein
MRESCANPGIFCNSHLMAPEDASGWLSAVESVRGCRMKVELLTVSNTTTRSWVGESENAFGPNSGCDISQLLGFIFLALPGSCASASTKPVSPATSRGPMVAIKPSTICDCPQVM